jgi:hypothetical protein
MKTSVRNELFVVQIRNRIIEEKIGEKEEEMIENGGEEENTEE